LIDWAQIAGMRVVLAHAYDNVDPTVLLQTIRNDLPPLRDAVKRLLRDTAVKSGATCNDCSALSLSRPPPAPRPVLVLRP